MYEIDNRIRETVDNGSEKYVVTDMFPTLKNVESGSEEILGTESKYLRRTDSNQLDEDIQIFMPRKPPVVHSSKKHDFGANGSKILVDESKDISQDFSKDKRALQDKIVDLEQRDIQRSKELEDQKLGMKHKEIAIKHEEKHLKNQIQFLQQKLEEKDKELKDQFNQMQEARLELSQELKRLTQKDAHIKKQEGIILDKDRQILELNKQLTKASTEIDCLRLEMRDLKKYNIEELQKQEKAFKEKYGQLRDLVGEHKLKMTEYQSTVRRVQAKAEKKDEAEKMKGT